MQEGRGQEEGWLSTEKCIFGLCGWVHPKGSVVGGNRESQWERPSGKCLTSSKPFLINVVFGSAFLEVCRQPFCYWWSEIVWNPELKLIQEADSCLGALLSPCLLGIITYTCIFIICIIIYINIFIFGLAWSTCVGKIENSEGKKKERTLLARRELFTVSPILIHLVFRRQK